MQATAWPPLATISATVCSAGAWSRSLMTTRAPSLASLSAISRPMPRPEPDTWATWPSSHGLATAGDDVGHRLLGRGLVEVVDDDAGTFAGELERDFTADASARA
eukprot:gene23571-29800_t